MKISLIAAIGKNRELGLDNKLLWNIPEDLKRFREITKNHPIIMGRKTFDSIGRILPLRTNIVITRDSKLEVNGAIVVGSLDEALEKAKLAEGSDEIFVIGGGQIFEQAIGRADKIYLTIVEKDYNADTSFPDYSEFKHIENEVSSSYDGLSYRFLDLTR